MRILALDLSKTSTGWASFQPGDKTLASGAWVLGSEFTPRGKVFGNLHGRMSDLETLGHIDAVFYEKPLDLGAKRGRDGKPIGIGSSEAHFLLLGLAMHAESWAEAMGCRIIREVPMGTWRSHFLKGMDRKRYVDLKAMAVAKALALGFKTRCHDQAEAIGILDYATEVLNLPAPWHTPLQRAITAARA